MSTQEAGRIPQWTLGEKLRKAREDAGLQQQELADKLGISRRSISAYENDDSIPRRPVLVVWALATGVRFRWLEDDAPRDDAEPGGEDTEGPIDGGNIVWCSPQPITSCDRLRKVA